MEAPMEQPNRQILLNGKKTERVIFAVTPELKSAVRELAEKKCMSVSALISSILADAVVKEAK
jgi:predicted transcriptional regulator